MPTLSMPSLQPLHLNEECVDVSDSSPARPTPRHQPSDEECHLAAELRKCPSIPALALLVPLPQTQWELFKSTLKSNIQVSVHGVPKKFWCGKGLSIWASETKENPFQRFYRCEIALQWEDEAILDEVSMVEAKVLDLVHDFQSLSKSVTEQIDSHKTWLHELEVEMMSKLNEHMSKVAQSMDEATRQFKEDMDATLNSNMNTTLLSNNGPVHNFAAAVGIVLAIACLYWKLL
ncbi:unnamed protein product [Brassica oleracea]